MAAGGRPVGATIRQSSDLFHGTRVERKVGDLIEPDEPARAEGSKAARAYVYLTAILDEAIWDAEIAAGERRARVYVVEPTGEVEERGLCESQGHPSMSLRSRRPLRVVREVSEWSLYHGTRADLKPGDLIEPGHTPNFGDRMRTTRYVYFTRTLDAAAWGAELADGDAPGRIYLVEPLGPVDEDPNLTNRKFRGNPTKSFRSLEPLRVTGEIREWKGHSPEAIQAMRDGLERLKRLGLAQIDE